MGVVFMNRFLKKAVSLFMLASSAIGSSYAIGVPNKNANSNASVVSEVVETADTHYKKTLDGVLDTISRKVNAWDKKFSLMNEYLGIHEISFDEQETISDMLYRSIDNDLNVIWNILKVSLGKNDMKILNKSQLQWISEKSAYEPWVHNWSKASKMKAAEMTKSRIHYIHDYVQDLRNKLN